MLGLVALVAIAVLLPASRPQERHAAYGSAPDVRRFAVLPATTALSVTGAFAGGRRHADAARARRWARFSWPRIVRCSLSRRRTVVALAANSAAFNAGVAAGALTGGALLSAVGERGTFLFGGLRTLGVLTWPVHTPPDEVASPTTRRKPRIGLQ
ncbi:hypothetical protein [Streptomyces sp. R41]|uniref:Major facilitator superfamily (MFS) profile domain-containing protein n=1 Tax=Streptomyces sp. R41 TaxID=3238632 RepID=A0AB39RVE9_9ACTN